MAKTLAALMLGLCIALSSAAASAATAAEKKQPDWSQLTPEQQQILAPLASDWNKFDNKRRKKWLLTAKRYPKMKPEQQQRLQTQMRDWAELTPEQRRIARENFKKLAKQPPEKREVVKQKWRERQTLKSTAPNNAPPAPAVPGAPGGATAAPPLAILVHRAEVPAAAGADAHTQPEYPSIKRRLICMLYESFLLCGVTFFAALLFLACQRQLPWRMAAPFVPGLSVHGDRSVSDRILAPWANPGDEDLESASGRRRRRQNHPATGDAALSLRLALPGTGWDRHPLRHLRSRPAVPARPAGGH